MKIELSMNKISKTIDKKSHKKKTMSFLKIQKM